MFRWASWTFAAGGVIEILEPAGPDGFLHRFLGAHGRGVHHVTFKVPDLALVCAPPRDPPAVIQPGLLPPVSIRGLRVRAHSQERAITQWREVLQGEMGKTPEGRLVFRWSDSPLRLVVDVDATAPEGPTAIEIASERVVASLDAASARLGIRLTLHQGGH